MGTSHRPPPLSPVGAPVSSQGELSHAAAEFPIPPLLPTQLDQYRNGGTITNPPFRRTGSPDRQASPLLAVNLGSNNPFRTRALSPSNSTTPIARPERPTSTNPFLDDSDAPSPQSAPAPKTSSPIEKLDLTDNTRDLFVCHLPFDEDVVLTLS